VVKRKKTRSKTRRISFRPGRSKKKRKQKTALKPSPINVLKVLAVAGVIAAVGVGVFLLGKYVKKTVPVSGKIGLLQLVNPPRWVNKQLEEKIYTAARANGEDLKLDEDAARSVQNNLTREVAWLDKVRVRVTNDRLLIKAQWRKPIAMVRRGLYRFYVDANLVVLDYLPMPTLPIVEVKGLSPVSKPPSPGEVWQKADLAVAVDILTRLDRRDRLLKHAKPLLYEIDRIDVSNFNGRENSRAPHIVLYAKNTEIKWGAEPGKWQQYFESTDAQKIAKLYEHYKENGTLLSSVKYINLCDPQDDIPLPIDKY